MSSERSDLPPRQRPDDSELEDFLAGRSPISAAYREASRGEQAPPELEAVVMAAARAAPAAGSGARRPRWLPFAAAAASLVLGVSVLMQVWHAPEAQVTLQSPDAVADAAPAPVPESDALSWPLSIESGIPAPQAKQAQQEEAEQSRRKAVAKAQPMEELGSAAAADRRADAESKALAEDRQRQAAIRKEQEALLLFERDSTASSDSASALEAPAPAPASAAPLSAPQEARAMRKAPTSEPEPAAAASEQHMEGAAAASGGRFDSLPGPPPPAPVNREASESAEDWIARIRELLEREDLEAVRQELRRFVARYPDQALPPDLQPFAAPMATPAEPQE